MVRFRTLTMHLLAVAGLLLAGPVLAQLPPPSPDRVQEAIDITDRRIQQAKDLLALTPNPQAAAEVDQAAGLQAIAKQAFAQGHYGAAGRATMDARFHADRAIAILKGLPDPGRVQDQLARTRDILDRARDRLAHCDQPVVRDMMRTALDMQGRAELAYQETRYLAALQLTLSARERALRALQQCNVGESLDDTVQGALQRTDDVLARAHELVGPEAGDRARQQLANAENLQSRARGEAQAGHARPALRYTRMARELADRALRGAAGAGRR